ncbi:tyrosine-type recombinase/integrase [Streptomyces sp. NPDC054956]
MTELELRASGEVSTDRHDPRTDWPETARELRDYLADIYGETDPLPNLAGAWAAAKPSKKTQESRAAGLKRWEAYARSTRTHPLQAQLPLAEAYARHLEQTLVTRGPNKGKPLSPASRANFLAQGSSFHVYAVKRRYEDNLRNPFDGVDRPAISPDESSTMGLLPAEQAKLTEAARKRSTRAHAIVLFLYLLFPRVSEMLGLDVEDMQYDKGHWTVPLTRKGGKKEKVPLQPVLLHAINVMLDGRTTGPMFATRTGRRMGESEIWKLLRSLARVADLPQKDTIKPHALRHGGITDSLALGAKLEDVQDAAGHRSPRTTQKYNRRRGQYERHPSLLLAGTIATPEEPEPAVVHIPQQTTRKRECAGCGEARALTASGICGACAAHGVTVEPQFT